MNSNTIITGSRHRGIPVVRIKHPNGYSRWLRHRVRHSPTGLEWGYAGSGPADLALSILCYVLKDQRKAARLYMDFKFDVVAGWKRGGFTITVGEIMEWIRRQSDERGSHNPR